MEKAVLKTLIYADIFDYPLKAWEIHKWLIGKKATLQQVEKALRKLSTKRRIQNKKGYYTLPKRNTLVKKRIDRLKVSQSYLKDVYLVAWILKLIPWIELLGISGSLAMENSSKQADIDLFIVTQNNRLWITRLMVIALISLTGKRRTRDDNKKTAAGKVCVNVLLERSSLSQKKDLYTAHEILQLKVLWQRHTLYAEFLDTNAWAMEMLPNWISTSFQTRTIHKSTNSKISNTDDFIIEKWARNFQLRYMGMPQGEEKITETAVYFHPHDYRQEVLSLYKKKLKAIHLS